MKQLLILVTLFLFSCNGKNPGTLNDSPKQDTAKARIGKMLFTDTPKVTIWNIDPDNNEKVIKRHILVVGYPVSIKRDTWPVQTAWRTYQILNEKGDTMRVLTEPIKTESGWK